MPKRNAQPPDHGLTQADANLVERIAFEIIETMPALSRELARIADGIRAVAPPLTLRERAMTFFRSL